MARITLKVTKPVDPTVPPKAPTSRARRALHGKALPKAPSKAATPDPSAGTVASPASTARPATAGARRGKPPGAGMRRAESTSTDPRRGKPSATGARREEPASTDARRGQPPRGGAPSRPDDSGHTSLQASVAGPVEPTAQRVRRGTRFRVRRPPEARRARRDEAGVPHRREACHGREARAALGAEAVGSPALGACVAGPRGIVGAAARAAPAPREPRRPPAFQAHERAWPVFAPRGRPVDRKRLGQGRWRDRHTLGVRVSRSHASRGRPPGNGTAERTGDDTVAQARRLRFRAGRGRL